MIRLRKGPPPQILLEKVGEWTREYLDALTDNSKMTDTVRFRYRHAEVKEALRRDSHNKCIYCEATVGFGETDHINPVSKCPAQIVAWDNLGLVCKECNTHKGDYYAPAEPLLNPFVHEPNDHLLFLGDIVVPRPGDGMGLRTHLRLKLNRMDLIQKRFMRLDRLRPLIEQWTTHPHEQAKALLRQAILDEAADDKEFAATVRGYLRQVLGWPWPNEEPHNDAAVASTG